MDLLLPSQSQNPVPESFLAISNENYSVIAGDRPLKVV